MEAVKLGRRRISNLDCDGYGPMKRRTNGICHLEGATGGGNGTATNWHMNLLPSSNAKNPAPNVTPSSNPTAAGYHQPPPPKQPGLEFNHHHPTAQHHQQQANGGGGVHQTAAAVAAAQSLLESTQQQQQHLSSISAHPVPPPSLRESERMQSVERWINSIPMDVPIFVQTSLTQIVPITDPKSFPDELSVSDHLPSATNNSAADSSRVGSYDYYSQQTQVGGGQTGGGVASRGNTTTASTSGNHHRHHQLGPPPPGGYQPGPLRAGYHGNGGGGEATLLQQQSTAAPPQLADNQGIRARSFTQRGGGGPPNRFFNDYETQFVVKLFRDFFVNGSCPSLNEVRLRIAHSQLQGRRNANSVRAKVKRLQASGRWKDFEVLP